MKRLVVDLDGTLTVPKLGIPYDQLQPDEALVEQLRAYRAEGFEIIIYTARNMRTFNSSVGKISAFTLPKVVAWLKVHDIPFDEVHVGKPWCGTEGFYIDDRAIRPNEFKELTLIEIEELLSNPGGPHEL